MESGVVHHCVVHHTTLQCLNRSKKYFEAFSVQTLLKWNIQHRNKQGQKNMFHFLFNMCVCHSLFVIVAAWGVIFFGGSGGLLLCEGWLVLLQSEISHLSVTSLTGQAAITDCTMQLLLGGFSAFFYLFSKHFKREVQENQSVHPCFPPISIKLCFFNACCLCCHVVQTLIL